MRRSACLMALVAGLVLSATGTALILARAYTEAHDRLFQDSGIALRLIAEKGAQHAAVLTTLDAASPSVIPQSLHETLRKRMPQLIDLAHWRSDIGWIVADGSLPPARPPSVHPHQVEFEFEEASYWMFTDAPWAIRIDPFAMLSARDWPSSLSSAEVRIDGSIFALLHREPDALPVVWVLTVEKRLPISSRALTLRTSRIVTLSHLPWLSITLWNAVVLLAVLALLGGRRLRLARARERTRARLERFTNLDTFGEMAAGLAHELNQPLMAIVSHVRAAERLLDLPDERDNVRAALQTSVAQAKRAARIIERLRSAVGSHGGLAAQAFDPGATVLNLLPLFQSSAARAQVRLDWHDITPGARPLADQAAVEQILHNLIQNACDAVAGVPQAHVMVLGERFGHSYRFSVIDNGTGIDDADMPKVFTPFFTTRPHGLGLGLPLCQTLTYRQNGSLTLRNRPAGGAEASLCLPLADGHS
ncbi:sensor histidine kinase [Pandoraea anhela]|uniref:histidine kinase n=1 Tax=Pandoraea anhela TaxID=2508295 RepID=A0A5E4WXY7_9BURK|nr:ATP-binding protein [Pandoraea anhela]VVE27935.1 Sensor histidine kinase TmoS [Pandoraea anhela]